MVVPHGVLFGDGVCARIKQELLEEFNLHTIVRLPKGVFSPYTDIETNLLFFERPGPTRRIWYYQHPLPERRNTYTKTQPLLFDELTSCLEWWESRSENQQAWIVDAATVAENSYNLDIKNPSAPAAATVETPEDLLKSLVAVEADIQGLLAKMDDLIRAGPR